MTLKIKAAAAFHTLDGIKADTMSKSRYATFRTETDEYTYKLYISSVYKPAGVAVTIPLELGAEDRVFMNGFQSSSESSEKTAIAKFGGVPYISTYVNNTISKLDGGDGSVYNGRSGLSVLTGYSFCYFRSAENKMKLFASLDESNGYTIFKFDAWNSTLRISRDIEGVERFNDYEAISLFYAEGTEDEVFEKWFSYLGEGENSHAEKLAGYNTKLLRRFDEKTLLNRVRLMSEFPVEPNLFMVEGKYCKHGDWLNVKPELFPNGFKEIVRRIHASGMMAALTISPYTVSENSEVLKNHRNWILKNEDGGECRTKEGLYILDSTNLRVKDFIHDCIRTILFMWGFDMIKLNNLYFAAVVPKNGKSRGQIMCEEIKFLRKCCGGKLMYVNDVPLMPAFGIADYCVISDDNLEDITPKVLSKKINRESDSVKSVSSGIAFRRGLNKRAFYNAPCEISMNDKEVFYDDNIYAKEQNLVSTLGGLFTSVIVTTDNFENYNRSKVRRFQKMCELENADNIVIKNINNKYFVSYKLNGKSYIIRF